MKFINIRNLAIGGVLGAIMLVMGTTDAQAQSRAERERERQRIERQIERQRERAERRARAQRNRSERDYRDDRNYRDDRYRDNRDYRDDRTYRSESYYSNGAPAYNQGYQYGLMAGQKDRSRGKYNQSNVYRNSGSAPNMGDPTSTDYIYRQGYLQGYEDGYRGRNY